MQRSPSHAPRSRSETGIYFVDQGIVSASTFLVMLLLVRTLGLEIYGAFGMVLTIGLFVTGLQCALVSQPMLSIGPRQTAETRPEYYGAVLAQQLVFSALAGVGAWIAYLVLLGFWKDGALEGTLAAGIAMILARQGVVFVRSYFFAALRPRRALAVGALAHLPPLLALFALSRGGALHLGTVFWTLAASYAAAILLGLAWFESVRLTRAGCASCWARSWRLGRWLGAMAVFQWFSANAFLVAAGVLLGGGAVGALKAAHNVIGVFHVAFVALENFVPVDAARVYARAGLRAMARHLRRIFAPGLGLTVVLAAALAVGAGPLLRFLYEGEAGDEMILALRGYAALYVLTFAAAILNIAFRTVEDSRRLALCHILIALPVVFLAEPVVAELGFGGVVLGMVVQKAILVLMLGGAFSRTVRRAVAAPAVTSPAPQP